jgi:hypothetical protein
MARRPGFLLDRNSEQQIAWVVPGASELSISLVPEAIVMGRITLAGPDSPDGVRVELFRRVINDGLPSWISQGMVSTNSRGEYRFAELYAGDYRVGTHEVGDREREDFGPGGKMFGYPPVYFPEASDFPSASTIHLSPGKIVEASLSLARRQYYAVKISVPNAPPTGLNVSVSVRGDGAPGYSLGYAPDQTIRGMLPNGIYVVEAASSSQQGAFGAMNLRVENAPAESGVLALLSNGTIAVHVKEEFTVTVPSQDNPQIIDSGHNGIGMVQQAQQRYLNVTLESVSDFGQGKRAGLRPPIRPNDRSLAIDNVQPGRYWVRVDSSRGYAASVSSGGVDLQHEPLVVGPGGYSPAIEVAMRDDMASLDGTVEGAEGGSAGPEPAAGAAVSGWYGPYAYVYCIPQPDSPGRFTEVAVSSNGKFSTPQIPPGAYLVLAFKHRPDDLEYRNAEAMRAYESKGQVVRLVGGQTEHVQLQLILKAGEDAQ